MKRIITTGLILATGLYAGGLDVVVPDDISPAQTIEIIDENGNSHTPLVQNDGKYIGLGMGRTGAGSASGVSSTVILGYMFSNYFAVEFRYSTLLSDAKLDGSTIGQDIGNYALYLKQMLPLDLYVTPFALLGYGKTHYGDYSDTQMQWGGGLDIQATKNLGFTIDYESFYSGSFNNAFSKDIDVDSVKINSRYSF